MLRAGWWNPSVRRRMWSSNKVILGLCLVHAVLAVKLKYTVHSEEDSKFEEEDYPKTETWERKKATLMPYTKHHKRQEKPIELEDEKVTTEKPRPQHPNELIFPLIYKQNHINSMFKFGKNWYTWSSDKRSDGTNAISYYICYDEPKSCDDIGWERTEAVPKCAFQIDSLMPDDRACLNTFGVAPHASGTCDGSEQMKMSEIIKACGPRIHSLWRFVRVGRRPPSAPKPADVNSLVCEDEEECFISIEYRIHHDRITFSLHEPTRGQTFKSSIKREIPTEEENKVASPTEPHIHGARRGKKPLREPESRTKKFHVKTRPKAPEGKGVMKDHDDSSYQRPVKNKIKIREDMSNDMSE